MWKMCILRIGPALTGQTDIGSPEHVQYRHYVEDQQDLREREKVGLS